MVIYDKDILAVINTRIDNSTIADYIVKHIGAGALLFSETKSRGDSLVIFKVKRRTAAFYVSNTAAAVKQQILRDGYLSV